MSEPETEPQNSQAVPPPDSPMAPPPVEPTAPEPPDEVPETAAPDALTRMPGAGVEQTAAGAMPGGEPLNTLAQNNAPGEAGLNSSGNTMADDDTHDRRHGAGMGDPDRGTSNTDGVDADASAAGYAKRRGIDSGDPHES